MRRIGLVALASLLFACDRPPGPAAQGLQRTGTTPADTLPREASFNAEAAERWMGANAIRFDSARVPDAVLRDVIANVQDRRIAMLGSSELDNAQVVRLKLALVRALHEQGGFNVLAIDGPVWECTPVINPVVRYDSELAESCASPTLERSREMDALFDYVVSTRSTRNPLELVGLDLWRSQSRAAAARPAVWASLVARIDPTYTQEAFRVDSTFYERGSQVSRALVLQRFGAIAARRPDEPDVLSARDVAAYDSLASLFSAAATATDMGDLDRARLKMASNAARSAAHIARWFTQRSSAWTNAGEAMVAENLLFVADTLYPDQKVMVWTGNRRARRGTTFDATVALQSTVAEMVQRRRPEYRVYSLGLFSANSAMRRSRGIGIATSGGNFADLMRNQYGRSTYLDVAAISRDPGAALLRSVTIPSEGPRSHSVELRHAYDAVISVVGSSRLTSRPTEPAARCCPARVSVR